MKNIINLFLTGLLTIGIANAQDRGTRQNRTPEEMAKMQTERLTEQLSLSKGQQDSIYKYSLLASKEQRKLMETAGDNREAAFGKIRSLREENSNKIKSFLTEDQVKKYEEIIKNRPQGQGRRNQQ